MLYGLSGTVAADILTKDEYANVTGKYFDRSTRIARSSELSYSEKNAKELWRSSEEMVVKR